jgi:hypothetical protein
MGLAKISFISVLVLAIVCAAGASDNEGAYTGEYDGEEYMLIALDMGGGIYFFDFLSFDEEIDLGNARLQPDESYILDADEGSVLIRFEEDVCRFTNSEFDITLEFDKLFGAVGRVEGVYALDMQEDGALGLLGVERRGEGMQVSLAGWDKEVSGHAKDSGGDHYTLRSRSDELEISFEAGRCVVRENGQTMALDKDESRNPYIQAAESAAPPESDAGVYRGRSDDADLLVAVREIGGSILSFEFFSEQSTDEFGQGSSRGEEDGTVVETDAFRFIFGGEKLTWVNIAYDQQIDLVRISTGDDVEGLYFAVEQMAMLLNVEKTSKDNYLFAGTSYEKEHYFDAAKNEDHVYTFRPGGDSIVLSLAGSQARLIADGTLSRLERIGSFPKLGLAEYDGVIP